VVTGGLTVVIGTGVKVPTPATDEDKAVKAHTPTCAQCGRGAVRDVAVGEDFEYATLPGPFRYGRCRYCGHMTLLNRPGRDVLKMIYPASYYTVNPASPLFLKGFVYRRKLAMDVARIRSLIAAHGLNSVLDLGCGDAARLLALRNAPGGEKLRLAGIDLQVHPEVRRRAEQAGIELYEDDVESFTTLRRDDLSQYRNDPSQSRSGKTQPRSGKTPPRNGPGFDLVLMCQLLEHLYEPEACLQHLGDLMNPGGLILIETPHADSWDYHLFGRRFWGGYHFPRHFNVFSRKSLASLVERCGWRVVKQGYLPSPGFWIISLRNRLGLSSRKYSRSLLEVLNFSNPVVVATFTLWDKLTIALGGRTSNQYLLAAWPETTRKTCKTCETGKKGTSHERLPAVQSALRGRDAQTPTSGAPDGERVTVTAHEPAGAALC